MEAKQTQLTHEGLRRLEEELEELKTVKRRDIADKIKVALSYGDLSENSEYDEAKNEQGLIEGRIAELEAMLMNVKIIDMDDIDTEKVQVGNKVELQNIANNTVRGFKIVGSNEVDMKLGYISDESPVGKACLGHAIGDELDVEAPAGLVKYKIINITK